MWITAKRARILWHPVCSLKFISIEGEAVAGVLHGKVTLRHDLNKEKIKQEPSQKSRLNQSADEGHVF